MLHSCSNFGQKNSHFAFHSLPWGLGVMYAVHLRLIGKHVVNFLLVIIELFSIGVRDEALRANTNLKSACLQELGQFGPKFQMQGVVPHQPFF